jgi:hypothetical protein
MSAINITQGNFPLTDVADLPNVTIAFPGEHWSNRIAKGAIVPGEACVPVNYNGKLAMQRAVAADSVKRMAIATRVIEIPDVATGSGLHDRPRPERDQEPPDRRRPVRARLLLGRVPPDARRAARRGSPVTSSMLERHRRAPDRQDRRRVLDLGRHRSRSRGARSRSSDPSPPTAWKGC